jgi:enoyl-CoA hydratase/carnithine racemase
VRRRALPATTRIPSKVEGAPRARPILRDGCRGSSAASTRRDVVRSSHLSALAPSVGAVIATELAEGGAVRVVRIDRPERRNAVNSEAAAALHDAFVAFEAAADERVAVLTGDRAAFCAGADLHDLPRLRPSGPLGPTRLQLSKPVLAAVEGWCVAGGLELALWCDVRVAAASARFGCLERRWGVPLIDGGTQRLPRVVGLGRALDLVLTGREVDADEALTMGLVNRVVPDGTALDATVELAGAIAAFPQRCVVSDRACVYEGLGRPLAEGLALEDARGQEVIFAEGFADGVARFRPGTG